MSECLLSSTIEAAHHLPILILHVCGGINDQRPRVARRMLTGHRTILSCLCRPGERRWVAGSDIQFVFNHALCIDTATEHHKMSLTSAHLSRVRTALSVDIALRETALTALWRNCLLATAPYLEVIDILGIYMGREELILLPTYRTLVVRLY